MSPEQPSTYPVDLDQSEEARQSPARLRAQIERLTDALVRASQKSNVKEKLLTESSGKLRQVQDALDKARHDLSERQNALESSEQLVAKRSEQCRQLYDIVTTLEKRLEEQQAATDSFTPSQGQVPQTDAGIQTEEWVGDKGAAAVGEELAAERRSRAGERAAFEAKIQRLELSSAASQNSSNHIHLGLFSEIRERVMRELSYSIPDSKSLMSIVKDIDKHIGEFGGNE
eukprot:CAMPEP_0184322008 /NCGR_PEP_ID=MMETSP1049-20130417/122359_1 /TAXON_ID=77928 /ORGANISM="Proteomonas sulcata, Strain CCMP704" /LENGTH=228 /DNA_ID=CAMNT_0026643009 /DNA_START=148 /DNA_END=834 /DNA_ORIENTATION=-